MTANNKKPILLKALFLSITAALATDCFFGDVPEPERRVILKQAHRFSIMDEPKFVE